MKPDGEQSHVSPHLMPPPFEFFGGGHDPNEVKFGTVARRVVRPEELRGLHFALVGFPVDEGVRRNHGRPGAGQAPNAIRRTFYRLNAVDAFGTSAQAHGIGDLGNIVPAKTLEESQARLADVVASLVAAGIVPIILGGGHETARGHAMGLIAGNRDFAFYNIDPHLDVREVEEGRATSGNPIRFALEAAAGRMRYVCFGARPAVNAPAYAEYVLANSGTIHWESPGVPFPAADALKSELERESVGTIALSMDVDAVSSAFAPGSSAASPLGLSAGEFVRCAMLAGADARVGSFEISEYAPAYDRDFQTERLCAVTLQTFVLAACQRLRQSRSASAPT